MTLPPIFPAAEDDGCGAYRAIAKHVGCSEDQVFDAFRGLGIPEWSTPEHFNVMKDHVFALNKAAQLAEKLFGAMRDLHPDALNSITQAGGSTIPQIEYLSSLLSGDAENLNDWRNRRFEGGRSDPSAAIVAEGIRRLFRRLRRPITFGQADSGGAPSTAFGKAVEFALSAFGLRANWRRAAERAFRKQEAVESRRFRCAMARFERASTNRERKEF